MITSVFKKAFSVNAYVSGYPFAGLVSCFCRSIVMTLPEGRYKKWEDNTMTQQEEFAYDLKLEEIAKLNIFAPIEGEEDEEKDND